MTTDTATTRRQVDDGGRLWLFCVLEAAGWTRHDYGNDRIEYRCRVSEARSGAVGRTARDGEPRLGVSMRAHESDDMIFGRQILTMDLSASVADKEVLALLEVVLGPIPIPATFKATAGDIRREVADLGLSFDPEAVLAEMTEQAERASAHSGLRWIASPGAGGGAMTLLGFCPACQRSVAMCYDSDGALTAVEGHLNGGCPATRAS